MGHSGVVEWWEEWQLRILVLGSLTVQFILAIFGRLRKSHIHPWFRLFIWLSYLASDALAIYALATLFNRQKEIQSSHIHGNRSLEVLWAPILLIHLGGQFNITAYNIEDNELWIRQIITMMSQAVVTLYVFCKSWPSSDKMIGAATIVLSVPAGIKCLDKLLALKRASFNSLASSLEPAPRFTTRGREQELEGYIQELRIFIQGNDPPPPLDSHQEEAHLNCLAKPDKLFVDLIHPYSDRLTNAKSFWELNEKTAYSFLNEELSNIFDRLYTKHVKGQGTGVMLGFGGNKWTQMLTATLPLAAMYLFVISLTSKDIKFHERGYYNSDATVTIVLLAVTYALELLLPMINTQFLRWNNTVSQHCLMGLFASKKRHVWLMSIAARLQCKDLIEQYWHTAPCYSAEEITVLVRRYVKDWWKNFIVDAESYRKLNDVNGQWTLEHYGCEQLAWSLEKPFDESVLIWHVATDFCFHHNTSTYPDLECVDRCREISNYMVHLLVANPEMLMAGTRENLFTTAYEQLEAVLNLKSDKLPMDKREVTRKVIDKARCEDGFIRDAWVLAEGLMGLGDERKMWEVIRGVWVEMLCFSAGRCRGYLHAKSLGNGGELLSFIWLLLAYSGMETLPERLQRQHWSPQGTNNLVNEQENVASFPSASEVNNEAPKEEEKAAALSASQVEGTSPVIEIVVAQ